MSQNLTNHSLLPSQTLLQSLKRSRLCLCDCFFRHRWTRGKSASSSLVARPRIHPYHQPSPQPKFRSRNVALERLLIFGLCLCLCLFRLCLWIFCLCLLIFCLCLCPWWVRLFRDISPSRSRCLDPNGCKMQ